MRHNGGSEWVAEEDDVELLAIPQAATFVNYAYDARGRRKRRTRTAANVALKPTRWCGKSRRA